MYWWVQEHDHEFRLDNKIQFACHLSNQQGRQQAQGMRKKHK